MLAKLTSAAVLGVDAYLVHVEVDLSRGLPVMNVVGLPENAVREGRERVGAALANSGFDLPSRRITVNLAPADVPKRGSGFDLPIAVGILAAQGALPLESLSGLCLVGELGLNGDLRPVPGALPFALRCAEERVRCLILARESRREAGEVERVEVRAAATLAEVVAHLRGERPLPVSRPAPPACAAPQPAAPDYRDVRGQEHAKRALEVAAAGAHNVLMVCRYAPVRQSPLDHLAQLRPERLDPRDRLHGESRSGSCLCMTSAGHRLA